jgi:hypothetical protein
MSKIIEKQTRSTEQPTNGWAQASDEELIAAYMRSGERQAFDALVHR